jgi:hypothetical protein
LVDGTTSSMPDTPENQRAFPQPNTQGIGLGFPIVRMVASITLQTITAFQEVMRRAAPVDREFLLQAMLLAIAQQEVGDRFGRVEARAHKRRPKAQRYLMEPRATARKRLRKKA